jgi:hypothetical protein
MKSKTDQTAQVTKSMECPFTDLKVCLRQTNQAKLDMLICTNCILGRIEKHLYAVVKKLYSGTDIPGK